MISTALIFPPVVVQEDHIMLVASFDNEIRKYTRVKPRMICK
jgi:hypothetical protein